ncbi:MAG: primosomal protein N' [Nitrospiraceae bacterium]|nr:primosomal protein N' [Nitrospiraceae bacterium]
MISTQAPPRTEPEALFADVIVPRHLAGPFTYIVPLSLRPTLRIGHRVLVPFGRTMLQGAVVTLSPTLPYGLSLTRLKEIDSLLPEGTATDVSPDLFQLSRQVAEQYVAPWGQCLRLVLPPTAKPQKPISHYQLTEQGKAAVAAREPCSVKERALLVKLHKAPSGLRKSYRRSGLADLLQDLTARGWVREVHGSPSASTTPSAQPPSQLSLTHPDHAAPLCSDQAPLWAEPLFETLNNPGPSRVLVQAPWADRLKLLQQTIRLILDRGQTILILVGEAERAQWVADLIRDDKRNIAPACFHSGLLDQAKAELWDQIHRQVVRVIVGTRSAIFLPLTAIGAMWVEGEEDAAFKEAQEPRYHARDVAWLRAQTERTVLILSSSHPFLETRANVEQGGVLIYKSIPSDTRPAVQVLDLRKQGYGTVLSLPLIRAIQQTISRKAGVLLFLNRKGYAGALVCRDCGQVPRCPACRVALMYSRQTDRLLCSYCGERSSIPDTCHSCSGPRIQLIGEGTERVEEDAKRLFPHAAVIRLDGDTMKKPAEAKALWQKIDRGEWDIIVGTQLLLRRGPLPTMGLVGIVQADAGLSVPDFRSAERTYHTLLDAVALADPAGTGGQVILQTSLASHHAIQALAQDDESLFLSEELSHRGALGYPPSVHLIALLVSGTDGNMVRDAATAWAARLTACASPAVASQTSERKTRPMAPLMGRPGPLIILGPAPSPVTKLRGRYRWQILVKSLERQTGIEVVRTTVKDMERTHHRRSIKFDVDVDPIEMW